MRKLPKLASLRQRQPPPDAALLSAGKGLTLAMTGKQQLPHSGLLMLCVRVDQQVKHGAHFS